MDRANCVNPIGCGVESDSGVYTNYQGVVGKFLGGYMKKFNNWLDRMAVKITSVVGSMWCAIIFTIIALTSLPSVFAQCIQSSSIAPVVQWLAQTFLQLVLLSIILKGQNISSEKTEQVINRINEITAKTEDTAKRIEHIVKVIEKDEKKELKGVEKVIEKDEKKN